MTPLIAHYGSQHMAEAGELSQAQRDQLLTQIAGNLSIIKDELVLRRVREDGKMLALTEKQETLTEMPQDPAVDVMR